MQNTGCHILAASTSLAHSRSANPASADAAKVVYSLQDCAVLLQKGAMTSSQMYDMTASDVKVIYSSAKVNQVFLQRQNARQTYSSLVTPSIVLQQT
jgi:hypothetical protein